jgi:MYXO-CTERM domain-containing protein
MTRRSLLVIAAGAIGLAGSASTAAAERHDVRGFLSKAGLDFAAAQVPSYVPRSLKPAPVTQSVTCLDATQRKTTINLGVDALSLTVPRDGRLRLDATLHASGSGELFMDSCVGDTTCQDAFDVRRVRAIVELDVALVSGKPRVSMADIDVQLDAGDVDITFSGCVVGDIAEWVIDFAEEWIIDYVTGKVEEIADQQIAPMLEELMTGLGYQGAVGTIDFGAKLGELDLRQQGLALAAAIELDSKAPSDTCVPGDDADAPGDIFGDRPDLSKSTSQVTMAANFGVVNDAIYQAWRAGMLCVTDDTLAEYGVHLPLDMVAGLLPGFPPGSDLGVEVTMRKPPVLLGVVDDKAALGLKLEGLEVSLTAITPDGGQQRLSVTASATAIAAIGIDPASNGLVAELRSAKLDELEVDQVSASKYGFDVGRLGNVVEDQIIPKLMADVGHMPLTGPVFTAEGYAVILRKLATTENYLTAGVDLFRASPSDVTAPETTLVRVADRPVSPRDVAIEVTGDDDTIPLELMQYHVEVDGVGRLPTFVRAIRIGTPGESGTYQVSIRAGDLSGNLDGTPATASITVDGVPPVLVLEGDRTRLDEGPIDLAWRVSDDQSATGAIALRADIYEVDQADDLRAVTLLEKRALAAGETEARIEGLTGDALYRVDLVATDEVGNESVSSVLVDLRTGGCQAGGAAGGGLAFGLALVALALGRRRRP